jgi:alginate O-acetyltransferase complex protein AlgI
MFFNSLEFVIFFPLVVFAYFALPYKWRWSLLLLASYYFYMCWRPEYIILIIASTLIDYFAGLRMGQVNKKKRKKYLILSLCTNLGLLFAFKYFNFFNNSLQATFNQFNLFYNVPAFSVLLPVGISFYTFQTLSYSIDVYRGDREPERHLGIFALYVAFFPQLVAGPIERSTHLLPQFYEKHNVDYVRITNGLKLMTWGFFKKLVIADRLAIYVNQVYNAPGDFHGAHIWIATYFFAIQIFCDFSGYSDIAIGAAEIMGYRFMKNFRRPYLAQSIAEFWKRWHISLSTWFRDYLYIPLGGNRVGKWRWYYNLFVVFMVSGLWHGANWTFVVWGALHGLYLVFAIVTQSHRESFSRWIGLTSIPMGMLLCHFIWNSFLRSVQRVRIYLLPILN